MMEEYRDELEEELAEVWCEIDQLKKGYGEEKRGGKFSPPQTSGWGTGRLRR